MTDRIHKVLAAAGIASRRQAEAWIAAGRITVNGHPATAGQPVGLGDRIAVDGRPVRINWKTDRRARGLVYHRPAGEEVRGQSAEPGSATRDHLPKLKGSRWIPVSAMSAGEGGLELFLTDGALVEALNKHTERVPVEYSVRLRGAFDATRIDEVLRAAAEDTEARGAIDELAVAGGEGVNRWARLVCRGLRPRDLKRIFERCGIEANRILRVRFGPIGMDRALARGRSRDLTDSELQALAELAGLRKPAARKAPGRARAGRGGGAARGAEGAKAGPAKRRPAPRRGSQR